MNLTQSAIKSSRLTVFACLLLLFGGIFTFFGFPSQEEPSVTIREALVSAALPGLPSEEVEERIAKPLEERLREVAGIKRVVSTIRPGSALIQLTAQDSVDDLPTLWQRVRAKAAEASAELPPGTQGPLVDDDFGRVAVASIAVTAPGFSTSEMMGPLRAMREELYRLPGVERVTMYGLQEDRVYVDFDRSKLASTGATPNGIIDQLKDKNVLSPGGEAIAAGLSLTLSADSQVRSAHDLADVLVSVPNAKESQVIRLGDLADVRILPPDPPEGGALYKGKPAIVVAVSMAKGYSIETFGKDLRAALDRTQSALPVGFEQHVVTFQPDVVEREMGKMQHVMGETVVIVMAVVMLFLGWRTGLIVGAIVPLTILGSLVAMRALGVELQTVSIAAIILALGLLVDNGIVIAEDIERRLAHGQERISACVDAGRTLAIPLLTSSLVIILAFSPFFFGQTSTNEYLRSLAIVLAVTLLGSWILSITVTPLLCIRFAKVHVHAEDDGQYQSRLYKAYSRIIAKVLDHKVVFMGTMAALLAGALVILTSLPYDFLPKSDRLQFQMPVTLEPGAASTETRKVVTELSAWFADREQNPEVTESIGYVADGGPRIVLGLTPPLPASNVGYFTVSVAQGTDIDAVIRRAREHVLAAYPTVRADPKRFSLGTTEAGVAVYRIYGPDEDELRRICEEVSAKLAALGGMQDVYDDWGKRIPSYTIKVNAANSKAAGVSNSDIAESLRYRYSGAEATRLHSDGTATPVILRSTASERAPTARPEDTLVYSSASGKALPLGAIATVEASSEPSTIVRRNLMRSLTVTGKNPGMTTSEIVAALKPEIAAIKLPPGYRIELGGEMEDAAEANDALLGFMPHALGAILLLFVWQFNSFRKAFIVIASIPFVLIGASLALLVTGYPFGFMATFGLLALAGIIVNNAVLLLERIEAELEEGLPRREAVVSAAVKRLRPILMTKLTCIVGLVPLMLFAGPLWTGMAITMIGGLALGTLVTLGLIPALYDWLFSLRIRPEDAR